MSKFYTYAEWETKFKPVKNHLVPTNDINFETYGAEVEYLTTLDPKTVWTWVDGDSGSFILSGFHYVNRINYHVTEIPWEDEFTEIPVEIYEDCDCINEGENDPDDKCEMCEGSGTITNWVSKREELVDLYGQEAVDAS